MFWARAILVQESKKFIVTFLCELFVVYGCLDEIKP